MSTQQIFKRTTKIILLAVSIFFWSCLTRNSSQTIQDVDQFILKYNREQDQEKRVYLLQGFLEKLNHLGDTQNEEPVRYFFKNFATLCSKNNDESILIAIDNTKAEAAFGNYVCDFYSSVKSTEIFLHRYSNNLDAKKNIELCEGTSFAKGEVERILGRVIVQKKKEDK